MTNSNLVFTNMKLLLKTFSLIALIGAISSCGNEASQEGKSNNGNSQITGLTFSGKDVEEQFQHYIHLKTALVYSDVKEAKSGAAMIMKNTSDSALKEILTKISEANDIEVQRTHFSDVSERITALVGASISSGEIYQQYCPMAFNNEGGYWLSTEKAIRNPYFGDKMLKCGKVTKTIKK